MLTFLFAIFFLSHLLLKSKIKNTPQNYFVAGQNRKTLAVTLSLSSTILGASAIIGTVGLGYNYGLYGIFWLLSGSLGLIILSFLIQYLPKNAYTLPQLASIRGGVLTEKAVAIVLIPAWIAISAAQFKATSYLLSSTIGLSPLLSLIVTGSLISFYLFSGGQISVFKSDAYQFIFIILGLLIGSVFLFSNYNFFKSTIFFQEKLPSNYGFSMIFPILLAYITGPDIHSRLLSTKDNNIKRKSLLLSSLIIFIAAFILVSLGIYAKLLGISVKSDEVLFKLIIQLPFYIRILLYLSVLSALISSADTCIFTLVSITALDLLKKEVKTAKLLIPFYVIIIIVTAWKGSGIIPLMMLAYKIFSGVLGGFVFSSLFFKMKPKQSIILLGIVLNSFLFLSLEIMQNPNSSLITFVFSILYYLIFPKFFQIKRKIS